MLHVIHYAACHYATCRVIMLPVMSLCCMSCHYTDVIKLNYHCHYAKCHHAKCHYNNCRGAISDRIDIVYLSSLGQDHNFFLLSQTKISQTVCHNFNLGQLQSHSGRTRISQPKIQGLNPAAREGRDKGNFRVQGPNLLNYESVTEFLKSLISVFHR